MLFRSKIAATTLGETGGDAVTMSMNLGYLVGTAIFAAIFLAAVSAQITAKRFRPLLYWAVIVATTTAGTTLADLLDRSLGIGYLGGSTILFALLVATLALWHRSLGSVAVNTITSRKAEIFYWATIMFSQTLGTALGDWMADSKGGLGLGYQGGALIFAAGLALVAAAYFWTKVSHTLLFWVAFILSRPLGATVGDWLDKPLASGGLALSRYTATAVLAAFILGCILLLPQRAEQERVRDAAPSQTLRYSSTAAALHWLLAILLVGMIGVGWYMLSIEDQPGSGQLFSLHKSVGIVVLALVGWRLTWRLGHPPAPLPVSVPAWQERASKASHRLLYAAMITMPLLGLAGAAFSKSGIEFFGLSIPRAAAPNHDLADAFFTAHSVVAWVLVALIAVHVLAALKHLIVNRDGVFQRMWFS